MIDLLYFKKEAENSSNLVKEIRNWLHQYPELSFNEKNTASFIVKKLDEWNIPYQNNIGGNGIIAWIKGSNEDKNIAIRADMDALPIQEANDVEYKSKNDGIMHACGHDVHMACLLGALFILNKIKSHLKGTIYAIFQPAEEKLPGGAIKMLNSPFFKNKKFDAVIAQHVYPDLPAGYIGIKPGPYMASTDEIYITIKGKGGHAATPNSITDTVYIASNLIVNLQSIVSRKANPIIPTVLSFGKVIANGATNIIPDEVKIEGTFRTFDEEWRYKALSYIKETTENLVNTSGANAEINIINGYPVLINDIALTEKVSFLAKRYLQEDKVVILQQRTTAEDFAYFSHKYPSLMYRLGTGGIDYCSYPLHSSKFEVNPNIFSFCHGLMAYIAYELTKTYSTR